MSDAYPTHAENLEVNEADDGLVVYDPATSMIHHLNASAAVIFDLCDGSRDVNAIAAVLAEAFSLDETPLQAARDGVGNLAERGLVSWPAHVAADG